MNDLILLVDDNDQVIGYGEKMEVHRRHQLHRAFSIFIFDVKSHRFLLQKRAMGKYHSGGLWTNACCSHPRAGEQMDETLMNRLNDELGIQVTLEIQTIAGQAMDSIKGMEHGQELTKILEMDGEKCPKADSLCDDHRIYECGVFQYYAPFEVLAEKEIDHVFLYCPEHLPNEWKVNPEEVDELMWISVKELDQWLLNKPDEFTAWFARAYEKVRCFCA